MCYSRITLWVTAAGVTNQILTGNDVANVSSPCRNRCNFVARAQSGMSQETKGTMVEGILRARKGGLAGQIRVGLVADDRARAYAAGRAAGYRHRPGLRRRARSAGDAGAAR